MKTIFAALIAAAIASPALAQTAQPRQSGQQQNYGTYNGYPTSEWYRQDSW